VVGCEVKFYYQPAATMSPDEVAVLGQQGFLEYSTAMFDGEAGTLELRPNASLPAGSVPSKLE
jgi:hypothetical protein